MVAPNTWREMHPSLFIFLPKIVNMWSMETKNKGKTIGVGKIGTNPSTSIKKIALLIDDLMHGLLRLLVQQAQQVVSNDTKRPLVFVNYF